MQKRKVSCTFKRENLSTLEIQERIYLLAEVPPGPDLCPKQMLRNTVCDK